MNAILIQIISNSIKTILSMLSTIWGFVLSFLVLLGGLVVKNEIAFYAAFAAMLCDLGWGIFASIKQKKFVVTTLLKKTTIKLFLYMSVFFMVMLIEHGLNDGWYFGTKLVCIFAALCEMWSSFANMLIVKPDFPFISLLRKSLAGEIANKLNLSRDEVEQELNKKRDDNSNICF